LAAYDQSVVRRAVDAYLIRFEGGCGASGSDDRLPVERHTSDGRGSLDEKTPGEERSGRARGDGEGSKEGRRGDEMGDDRIVVVIEWSNKQVTGGVWGDGRGETAESRKRSLNLTRLNPSGLNWNRTGTDPAALPIVTARRPHNVVPEANFSE
jgi:hypothetical protein